VKATLRDLVSFKVAFTASVRDWTAKLAVANIGVEVNDR
jgi:hypothetical protein